MKNTTPLWQRSLAAFGILTSLLVAGSAFLPQTAEAQGKPKVAKKQNATDKLTKSRGEAGVADPNIKDPEKKGNPKPFRPAAKGGPVSRAAAGVIIVDNYTGYYVDVYVDGVSQGTVAPYGDLSLYGEGDVTYRLYAKVEPNISTFGPRTIFLREGGSYRWKLTE